MIFDLILPLLLLFTPFTIFLSFILLGHAYEDYRFYKHITPKQYKKRKVIYYSVIAISVIIILINLFLGNIAIRCCNV